jgi:hypothetical protein
VSTSTFHDTVPRSMTDDQISSQSLSTRAFPNQDPPTHFHPGLFATHLHPHATSTVSSSLERGEGGALQCEWLLNTSGPSGPKLYSLSFAPSSTTRPQANPLYTFSPALLCTFTGLVLPPSTSYRVHHCRLLRCARTPLPRPYFSFPSDQDWDLYLTHHITTVRNSHWFYRHISSCTSARPVSGYALGGTLLLSTDHRTYPKWVAQRPRSRHTTKSLNSRMM